MTTFDQPVPPVSRVNPLWNLGRRTRLLRLLLTSLIRRATVRMRRAKGWHAKFAEARRLLRKGFQRLRRRGSVIGPFENNPTSEKLTDFVKQATMNPQCSSLGGGLLALSVSCDSDMIPEIVVWDRFGNSHATRTVESVVISRGSLPGKPSLLQMVVRTATELADPDCGNVEVRVDGIPEPVVYPDIDLKSSCTLTVTLFSREHNLLHFSGTQWEESQGELKLGLFVDGRLAITTVVRPQARTFFGSFLLGYEHFDGRAHLLELRRLPEMDVLASSYVLLPLHITPWDALQTYARAPLDDTLSPAARHHFLSYRLWFDKLAKGATDVPPIAQLNGELLQGWRKRRDYPELMFSRHARPLVSIVIPVHNKFEVTYFCLCSLLFAYNDTPFEVIVVDDASTDETQLIEQFVRGIRVVHFEENRGFVDACNEGAALATGEYIVLLNNDVEATARWLDELIGAFRSFDHVGLAGSKLVYGDGKLQEAGGIVWRSGNPWNVGREGNAHDPRYNYLREVDYVSGAAIMVPAETWKDVGGFSAEFAPAYFEDTDLAMKMKARGLRVLYVPTSTIVHFEGQSAGTEAGTGMKRFQEVNRPKFARKWAPALASHSEEGMQPDREKDRSAALRVLFVDQQFPRVDADAGSYAAFQEIRLFQSLGAKVTFLPRNLAFMDRHTLALQRIGVECLYAPYVTDFLQYLRSNVAEFDVVFVCRYQLGEQVIPTVRASSSRTQILFNLADLHFLRELREAAAGTEGYSPQRAEATREAELAVIRSADLTFSYSDAELAVLAEHTKGRGKTARLPWVVEAADTPPEFRQTRDLVFLGGFDHPPNAPAVWFFGREVMPGLQARVPDIHFDVVGRGAEEMFRDYMPNATRILGYVPDLETTLREHRVFVAPLLAGAGLKGKVIEAIARGMPCVLSQIAAEGTGLVDGESCLVANTPQQWIECVARLYGNQTLWEKLASNALNLARTRYSFTSASREFGAALAKIGIRGNPDHALVYRQVRPRSYGL